MTTLKDLLRDLIIETQEEILRKTDSAIAEQINLLTEIEIDFLTDELLTTFVTRHLGFEV